MDDFKNLWQLIGSGCRYVYDCPCFKSWTTSQGPKKHLRLQRVDLMEPFQENILNIFNPIWTQNDHSYFFPSNLPHLPSNYYCHIVSWCFTCTIFYNLKVIQHKSSTYDVQMPSLYIFLFVLQWWKNVNIFPTSTVYIIILLIYVFFLKKKRSPEYLNLVFYAFWFTLEWDMTKKHFIHRFCKIHLFDESFYLGYFCP